MEWMIWLPLPMSYPDDVIKIVRVRVGQDVQAMFESGEMKIRGFHGIPEILDAIYRYLCGLDRVHVVAPPEMALHLPGILASRRRPGTPSYSRGRPGAKCNKWGESSYRRSGGLSYHYFGGTACGLRRQGGRHISVARKSRNGPPRDSHAHLGDVSVRDARQPCCARKELFTNERRSGHWPR